ncbi:MAG: hypothetical protein AAFR21_14065 [Pseudomonadota bacterium]
MENFQLQSAALREKWAEGDFTASPLPKKHDVDAVRPGMLAEMTFVRLVDNYMIFLQDILALIYSADPKKAGKIRVDIGEWPNLTAETDIFSAMRGLAIASISETTRTTLFDAFKKLGITTVTLQRSRHELSEALDIRDQIVHRRGLWGNFKGDEFPSTRRFRENWSCGKTVREFEKKNGHLEQFIWDSVTAIDDEAIKCYSLESFAVPNSKPRG